MLLVQKSILRELLLTLILSIFFLNFSLMMEKLLRLSRILAGVGASVWDFAKMILCLQPQLLILTIPMALLLSVLLTYGRMNADNELTILKMSGLSFRSISKPLVYAGVVCCVTSLFMSFYGGPMGSALLRQTVTEILTTRAPLTIEEGVFNTSFKDIMLLVREKPAPDRLSGIFIVDERKKDEQKIIVAREGRIIPGNEALAFSLSDGHIYLTKQSVLTEIRFSAYRFELSPSAQPADRRNSELTPTELLEAAGQSTGRATSYLLEFHRRLSMPAICLVIILLGPPLSLVAGKSGRLGGLTTGLLVFVVYYSFLLWGENLVRSGNVPHLIGAWMSFGLLAMVSVVLFERVNKR